MEKYNLEDISIDRFNEEDAKYFVRYWFHSPALMEKLAVDMAQIGNERDRYQEYLKRAQGDKKNCISNLKIVTVLVKGKRIGVHTLTHVVDGKEAMMHAHFWSVAHRKRGIGTISYVKAMDNFFKRFNFNRIYFNTPTIHEGPNRVKEKLGIKCTGEGIFEFKSLLRPLSCKVYQVMKQDMPTLFKKLSELYPS